MKITAAMLAMTAMLLPGCAAPFPETPRKPEGPSVYETLMKDESDRKLAAASAATKRRNDFIRTHAGLPKHAKDGIRKGEFWIGMTDKEASASMGEPDRVYRNFSSLGSSEQRVYGGSYLYFYNGILKSYGESQ